MSLSFHPQIKMMLSKGLSVLKQNGRKKKDNFFLVQFLMAFVNLSDVSVESEWLFVSNWFSDQQVQRFRLRDNDKLRWVLGCHPVTQRVHPRKQGPSGQL